MSGNENTHCVYRITNDRTGREYIGVTSTAVAVRWHKHMAALLGGSHANKALQSEWNTYGPDAFSFRIVKMHADGDEAYAHEGELIDSGSDDMYNYLGKNEKTITDARIMNASVAHLEAKRKLFAFLSAHPKASKAQMALEVGVSKTLIYSILRELGEQGAIQIQDVIKERR